MNSINRISVRGLSHRGVIYLRFFVSVGDSFSCNRFRAKLLEEVTYLLKIKTSPRSSKVCGRHSKSFWLLTWIGVGLSRSYNKHSTSSMLLIVAHSRSCYSLFLVRMVKRKGTELGVSDGCSTAAVKMRNCFFYYFHYWPAAQPEAIKHKSGCIGWALVNGSVNMRCIYTWNRNSQAKTTALCFP